MWWNEVFKYVKTFSEVSRDRNFDCSTLCIRHKSTHSCKLTNLVNATTGTWVSHHKDWVELTKVFHHGVCDIRWSLCPNFNCLLITFFICKKTHLILLHNSFDLLFSIGKDNLFLFRNFDIWYGNSYSTSCRILITCGLNLIKHFGCFWSTANSDTLINNFTKLFLTYNKVDFKIKFIFRIWSVNITDMLRNIIIEYNSTDSCTDKFWLFYSVNLLCNFNKNSFV